MHQDLLVRGKSCADSTTCCSADEQVAMQCAHQHNTLQQSTTVMQHVATWCGMLQRSTTWCNTAWHVATKYITLQRSTTRPARARPVACARVEVRGSVRACVRTGSVGACLHRWLARATRCSCSPISICAFGRSPPHPLPVLTPRPCLQLGDRLYHAASEHGGSHLSHSLAYPRLDLGASFLRAPIQLRQCSELRHRNCR
jgi:hypothetical protein